MTAAPFGMIGVFADAAELTAAAQRLRDAGFRAVEAYTPYPVEGLADLLHPARRRGLLPAIMAAGAVIGAAAGYLIQYWAEAIDYPINVGGRPYNSWPAFIVPAFEVTVLAVVAFGFVALFAACRLPRLYHPIFEAAIFERMSSDRFALCVEAADDRFSAGRIQTIFEESGAEHVAMVPTGAAPPAPAPTSATARTTLRQQRDRVMAWGVVCLALLALAALVSCDRMANQPKRLPYELPLNANANWARAKWPAEPPEGIVARDDAFGQPAPPPVTMALLERGRQRFDIYCAPCHARTGTGDGMIVQRGFPHPPSYFSDQLMHAPNQLFYDVITHGYGAMYSYADRVAPADRWAIVAYIRALQASMNGQVADVPPEQRGALK